MALDDLRGLFQPSPSCGSVTQPKALPQVPNRPRKASKDRLILLWNGMWLWEAPQELQQHQPVNSVTGQGRSCCHQASAGTLQLSLSPGSTPGMSPHIPERRAQLQRSPPARAGCAGLELLPSSPCCLPAPTEPPGPCLGQGSHQVLGGAGLSPAEQLQVVLAGQVLQERLPGVAIGLPVLLEHRRTALWLLSCWILQLFQLGMLQDDWESQTPSQGRDERMEFLLLPCISPSAPC